MSYSVRARFSSPSLLLIYLKSLEILSAGSPEVKPAAAHARPQCAMC